MTSNTDLSQQIQGLSPEQCAELINKPSSEVYYALKQKIHGSQSSWIQGFLDEGGLERLLDTLVLLSQNGQKEAWSSVCDAILQLDCLGCVRELVNFREGMEALLTEPTLVHKLTLALDTPNVYPKKQIFELLTCVAIAAKNGHSSVLGALENYQKLKHQAHRFTVILHEMKLCENSHYRSTLLGFVNALIQCSTDLKQRCRVRNELIGLKLLDVINFMKKDEKEPDFCVQMKIFYDSKQKDELELAEMYTMDYQDPVSIFETIHKSMVGTPELTSFLHVLQDMYRFDTSSCDRLLLWQTLAKITYALSNVNCEREAQLVMTKVYIALDSGISNPHLTTENAGKAIATQSSTIKPLTEEDIMAEVLSCSPDFHADRRKELAFPPASEDRDNDRLDSGISLKSYNTNTTTSPPLPCYSDYDNIEKKPVSDVVLLQQQNPIMLTRHFYPKERHHHQRYQHLPVIEETEMDCIEPDVDDVKGTDNVVSFSEQDANKRSALKTDSPEVSGKLLRPESSVVMAQVATKDTFDNNNIVYHKDGVNVNTQQRSKMKNEPKNNETVTSLLKQVMQKNLSESKTSSSSLSSEKCACTKMVKWVKVPDDKVKDPLCMWRLMQEFGKKILPIDYSRLERDFCTRRTNKADINGETSLLHPEVTLSLNLFLSRLETHPEFVVQSLRDGELRDLGVEAVRHLVAILPTDQEISHLDAFISQGGNIYELGDPEQLLLSLSAIPAFRLHLSAFVFTSDFSAKYCRLRDAFGAIIRTCNDVVQCERLQDFMRCALRVGNYLNKDTHLGKVDGVSLATWHRLGQVKCNNNHDNLLSWLVKYISDSEDPTLCFLSELPFLETAASCDLEEMKSEVLELNTELKKFVTQLNLAPKDSQAHFSTIMESVTQDLECLHSDLQMTRQASHQLMIYLCEEESGFDIQGCLKTLHRFIHLVAKIKEENSDRQLERQLAGRRVKQMIDQQIDHYFQDIFAQQDLSMTPGGKKGSGLVEHLLSKLQRGEVEEDYLGGKMRTDYKHLHSFVLPEHDSQRFSPDRNLSPVVPSHSTPAKADESILVIPELKDVNAKNTYADKADLFIKNQYRKDRQVLSASFIQQESNPKATQLKPDDHSPDTGTKPFPLDTSNTCDTTKPFTVAAGSVSQYENMQDINDIMMNVETYEQNNRLNKKNGQGIAANQKAGAFAMDVATDVQTGERRHPADRVEVMKKASGTAQASGNKFFDELDGKSNGEKTVKGKEGLKDDNIEKDDMGKVSGVKQRSEKELPQTEPLQPESTTSRASQRPPSRLGILKRFSKAILRQQDGNVQPVAGEKQVRKTVSLTGEVRTDTNTSAPVRSKSLPVPRKAPQMGTLAGSNRYQTKQPRTTIAANDKENQNIGNKMKPESGRSLKTALFRRQPKLEKSSSSATVGNNKKMINHGRVPLQKSNSAPVVEEESMVIDAHVIEVIEHDEYELGDVNAKSVTTFESRHQVRQGGQAGKVDTRGIDREGSTSSIPAFSRRNALPTRDKNAHGMNGMKAEKVGHKTKPERCGGEKQKEAQVRPMYKVQEITVKPSYGVNRDEELIDRVIDSKNVKYKISSMPRVSDNKGSTKTTQSVVGKDTKEGTKDRKYGTLPSNNRFGFGWKERKHVGVNENRASESGVIPTAPKHEIQQANKCTLKIYRKYNMQ